ncbi:MAG TPA: addiction module protein [Thermoanaerobaculia bacterium]|jgi:putative addiction module component (TIGR02574 family)|nr:addiction module protein [Thermoanaerobaculia bacterium]
MTKAEILRQTVDLPDSEKLDLAEAIWTSVKDPNAFALPEWQRTLLEERLSKYAEEEGQDWEDVRAEIWPSAE